jgi:hypothetical protein
MNESGMEIPTKSNQQVHLPPYGFYQLNSTNIGSDINCYVRLEANQPIVGWVSQIDNLTSDPGFAVSKGEGVPRILLQSSANGPAWQSSLVIVNAGNSESYVNIIARNTSGEIQSQLSGKFVPAGGFFSTDNILQDLGLVNSYGPIEIISSNNMPLIVTSIIRSSERTSAFFEGQEIE